MAGLNLMSLVAYLTLNSSNYEKGLDKAKDKAESWSSKTVGKIKIVASSFAAAAKGAGVALGAASAAVMALTKSAVNAYAKYEQLVGGVDTLYKKSSGQVQEYAKQAYKTAGLSANDYMELATSFAASLVNSLKGDTDKAAKLADVAIRDMSDNVNKMGSSVESVQNAYNGFAKGNFTMLDNLKLGYGGTKDEMQRLLNKAEEISGYKYNISSYSDIVRAIHVVQNEMGITGTTAKEADGTIQGSLAATKAAWENVITSISGGNIDLQTSIDALVESGINTINNIWPVISKELSGIAELVKQVAPIIAENLPGLVQEILPKLLDAAITLIGGVALALPSLFQVVLDAIGTLFTNIKAFIDERNPELGAKINAIAAFFVNAWTTVKGFWENTLKPAFDAMMSFVVNTLIPAISNVWTNVLQPAVKSVFNTIKALWEKTLKPVFDAMKTFIVSTLVPAISNVWVNVLQPKIRGAFNAIKTLWENTLKPVFKAIGDKANELKDKFLTPLVTFLKGTFLAAWKEVKDYWVKDLGPRIKALQEAFNTFKNDVLEKVATFLGDTFTKAWEAVNTLFNGDVKTALTVVGTAFKDLQDTYLKPAADWIKDTLVTAWDGLKTSLNGLITFLTGAFTGDWKGAWEGLVSMVSAPFDTIKSSLKTPINAAIDLLNDMLGTVEDAINWIVDGINTHLRVDVDFGNLPAFLGGGSLGGIHWGADLQGVSWGRLQTLYKGGVLDEGEEAMVGEFAPERLRVVNGKAIVTPLTSEPGRFGGGTTNNNININLYTQPGQDAKQIADMVQRVLMREMGQRQAAFV